MSLQELVLRIPPGESVVLERLERHDTVLVSVRRPASQLVVTHAVTLLELRLSRPLVVETVIAKCLDDMQDCCLRLLQDGTE